MGEVSQEEHGIQDSEFQLGGTIEEVSAPAIPQVPESPQDGFAVIRRARSKKDMRPIKTVFKKRCMDSCCDKGIDLLTRDDKDINEAQGQEADGWEKISVKIDSGAIDSCLPVSMCQSFKTSESRMSKGGIKYRAANGTPIKNFGEKNLKGWTEEGIPFAFKTQVAEVKTPLGSVYHMVKSGNKVEFDASGGRIINQVTGQIIPIKERGGSYEIDFMASQTKDRFSQHSRKSTHH